MFQIAPGRTQSLKRGVYLGNFDSTNATGITTVFISSSFSNLEHLNIQNENNNVIVIRSHRAKNVGSKVACGFIRQRK